MIQLAFLEVKSKFQRNTYSLKEFKVILIKNIKLNYLMVTCKFMSISLRAKKMISIMKSKAPNLEIKAFHSLHRVVNLKL